MLRAPFTLCRFQHWQFGLQAGVGGCGFQHDCHFPGIDSIDAGALKCAA